MTGCETGQVDRRLWHLQPSVTDKRGAMRRRKNTEGENTKSNWE